MQGFGTGFEWVGQRREGHVEDVTDGLHLCLLQLRENKREMRRCKVIEMPSRAGRIYLHVVPYNHHEVMGCGGARFSLVSPCVIKIKGSE